MGHWAKATQLEGGSTPRGAGSRRAVSSIRNGREAPAGRPESPGTRPARWSCGRRGAAGVGGRGQGDAGALCGFNTERTKEPRKWGSHVAGDLTEENQGTEAEAYLLASNRYLFIPPRKRVMSSRPCILLGVGCTWLLTPYTRDSHPRTSEMVAIIRWFGGEANSFSSPDCWPRRTDMGIIASWPPELAFLGC